MDTPVQGKPLDLPTEPAQPGPPVKRPVPQTREERMARDAEERRKGEQILDALDGEPQGTPEELPGWGVRPPGLLQKLEFWDEAAARDFYASAPGLVLYRREGGAWLFVERNDPPEEST